MSDAEATPVRLNLLILLIFLLHCPVWSQERLVIVGGGKHPRQAMARFHAWAGGEKSRILVIPWATEEPEENFKEVFWDYGADFPCHMELAPLAPLTPASRARFLQQLESASGVWFTGGDQVKVMAVLKDRSLLAALRKKYRQGTVFGGTSAGTAIMSSRMLTGQADLSVIDGRRVEIQEGLGLLPRGVIVDQHFLKRQRENRLFAVILANPDALGIGIDEDTALLLSEGKQAEVVGGSQVMLVRSRARDHLLIHLFQSGQSFHLDDF